MSDRAANILSVVVIVALLLVVLVAAVNDEQSWTTYRKRHNCHVVSTTRQRVYQPRVGKIPATAYDKDLTCYECDAGPRGTTICR